MADSSELEALRNARMAEMMASQQGGGGGGQGADAEAARRAEQEEQRAAMLAQLLLPAVGIDLDRRALALRAPILNAHSRYALRSFARPASAWHGSSWSNRRRPEPSRRCFWVRRGRAQSEKRSRKSG